MMQPDENPNDLSLPQILYALILALGPFIDSLVAKVEAEGRPVPPALRSLARTFAGLRLITALFNKTAAAPNPATSGPAARHRAHRAHPATRTPFRNLIPQPAKTTAALNARQKALLPTHAHPIRL